MAGCMGKVEKITLMNAIAISLAAVIISHFNLNFGWKSAAKPHGLPESSLMPFMKLL